MATRGENEHYQAERRAREGQQRSSCCVQRSVNIVRCFLHVAKTSFTLYLDLSASQRKALSGQGIQNDDGDSNYEDIPIGPDGPNPNDDDNAEDPPSDADDGNADPSNYLVFVNTVQGSYYQPKRFRGVNVSRKEMLNRNNTHWQAQYPVLKTAYLEWKSDGVVKRDPPISPSIPSPPAPSSIPLPTSSTDSTSPPSNTAHPSTSTLPSPPRYFAVDAVSLHGRDRHFIVIQEPHHQHAGQSLIRHGLISNSPLTPTIAFSILTIETFRRLRLRAPRTSIQSFIKVICDTDNHIFDFDLVTPFTEALDVYLAILRHVDLDIKHALGRNDPEWRIKHSCPACLYKVVDEKPLKYDILLTLDGGSSLKRFATAGLASFDLHFNSDYIILRDKVNEHAKKHAKKPAKQTATDASKKGKKGKGKVVTVEEVAEDEEAQHQADAGDVAMEMGEEGAGENGDDEWVVKNTPLGANGEDLLAKCTEHWKANADDSKKSTFECFEEAGVFVCLCRHGAPLTIADMVRSGEL